MEKLIDEKGLTYYPEMIGAVIYHHGSYSTPAKECLVIGFVDRAWEMYYKVVDLETYQPMRALDVLAFDKGRTYTYCWSYGEAMQNEKRFSDSEMKEILRKFNEKESEERAIENQKKEDSRYNIDRFSEDNDYAIVATYEGFSAESPYYAQSIVLAWSNNNSRRWSELRNAAKHSEIEEIKALSLPKSNEMKYGSEFYLGWSRDSPKGHFIVEKVTVDRLRNKDYFGDESLFTNHAKGQEGNPILRLKSEKLHKKFRQQLKAILK